MGDVWRENWLAILLASDSFQEHLVGNRVDSWRLQAETSQNDQNKFRVVMCRNSLGAIFRDDVEVVPYAHKFRATAPSPTGPACLVQKDVYSYQQPTIAGQ